MSIESSERAAAGCVAQRRAGVAVNAAPPGVVDWFGQQGCNPTSDPLVFCCPCGTGFPPPEVREEGHMVGTLTANGEQVASGGPEFIANCRTVPATATATADRS